MSVLDAFFSKGFFKAARCKTLLKLTIPRIKLLRNRREMQLKLMRKDIAKLLETGQEATARIRVEHIIREENMMAAQEIIELFCELISVRLPIIEAQRECPLDLKEALSTICFAAPRCADLPELLQVQMQFAGKYGKEFVAAASELRPDSGVNRQVIELLSVRVPSVEVKMKLLKEIAEEHEVDWDPAATEAEFLKPHGDLLNGPSQFIGGSTFPLTREQEGEPLHSAPPQVIHDEPKIETDTDLDSLDFPEVPKSSVLPDTLTHEVTKVSDNRTTTASISFPDAGSPNTSSDPEVSSVPQFPSQTSDLHVDSRSVEPMPFNFHGIPHSEPNISGHESLASSPNLPSATAEPEETKEFAHFIAPSMSVPIHQIISGSAHKADEVKQPIASTTAPARNLMSSASADRWEETASCPVQASRNSCSSLPMSKTETDVDLKDVLVAAQTAAESADRAAAAARAAASLAQQKITELMMKRNGKSGVEDANEIPLDASIQTDLSQNQMVGKEHLHGYEVSPSSPPKYESVGPSNPLFSHQTLRSSSLDEESYFSYPNLFSRQNSDIKSTVVDNSQTSKE